MTVLMKSARWAMVMIEMAKGVSVDGVGALGLGADEVS